MNRALKHADLKPPRTIRSITWGDRPKITSVEVYDTKEQFDYGNCATIAMAMAFNQKYKDIRAMFKLAKINCERGLTTEQCTDMINTLATIRNKVITTKDIQTHKQSVGEFIHNHSKGTYLIASEEHVCFVSNGLVIDGFYFSFGGLMLFRSKVERWWKIENKPRFKSVIGVSYSTYHWA